MRYCWWETKIHHNEHREKPDRQLHLPDKPRSANTQTKKAMIGNHTYLENPDLQQPTTFTCKSDSILTRKTQISYKTPTPFTTWKTWVSNSTHLENPNTQQ
jgi:hypothetical protein